MGDSTGAQQQLRRAHGEGAGRLQAAVRPPTRPSPSATVPGLHGRISQAADRGDESPDPGVAGSGDQARLGIQALRRVHGLPRERAPGRKAHGEGEREKNEAGLGSFRRGDRGPVRRRGEDHAGHGLPEHPRPGIALRDVGPAKAKALWDRFEFVYTPKHGSWLNMAEIELNVLGGQCLNRRFGSLETTFRQRLGSLTISSQLVVWQITDFNDPMIHSADLDQGRSDQDSSPCPTQPQSHAQTPAAIRHMHRLPRWLEAGSSNQRRGRRRCRST